MSKIIASLHALTGCDVTSSFFGVGKRTVWKRIQKSTEVQMLLTNISHENLNKFVIKYIYNDQNKPHFDRNESAKLEQLEK